MADGADASTGGLSPAPVGQSGGKRKGKMTPWLKHVMSVKKPGMSLGDAMKEAKKTYKKQSGGQLVGNATPMGGKRTRKNHRKGGALYGFGAGDGNKEADGGLADGAAAYGDAGDATWKGPSTLTGSPSAVPAAKGGRRSRKRSHRRRSSKTAKVGGKRRR